MSASLSIGAVGRDMVAVVLRRPGLFGLLMLVATAPGLLGIALLAEESRRITDLIASLLNLYLQLFATARTLELLGAMPADYRSADATEGRYVSAFGASFLSGIAILLGFVLLIVPGLLLLALWGVWMPAMLAERLPAGESLNRSWLLVRPRWKPVLGLVLVTVATYLLSGVLAFAPELIWGEQGMPWTDVALEFLVAVPVIGSPVLWAVAYCRLRAKGDVAEPDDM